MAKTIIETEPKFRARGSVKKMKTEPGNRMATTYEVEIDSHGHKELKATGKTDTYAKIQSYLEETKIENILARALLGDDEALNRVEGKYIDTTEMPKTLAEAQNMIIKMKTEFDSLPIEVRKEFNFSPEQFIATAGTEEWAKALGYETKTEVIAEQKEIKVEETAKDE